MIKATHDPYYRVFSESDYQLEPFTLQVNTATDIYIELDWPNNVVSIGGNNDDNNGGDSGGDNDGYGSGDNTAGYLTASSCYYQKVLQAVQQQVIALTGDKRRKSGSC